MKRRRWLMECLDAAGVVIEERTFWLRWNANRHAALRVSWATAPPWGAALPLYSTRVRRS